VQQTGECGQGDAPGMLKPLLMLMLKIPISIIGIVNTCRSITEEGIGECWHQETVTDRPVTRRKSVTFDSKAKVGALVQRARTFKKQKLAEEAAEDEWNEHREAYTRAVSTRQYAVVRRTGSVTGRMKTT
jgi:hypothetical protein